MVPSPGGDAPPVAEGLLALPSAERRAAFLEAGDLLNPSGLDRLLDAAERLVSSDPGKARRLAEACGELAGPAGAVAAGPRAAYVRARTHGINGEFEEQIRLSRIAYDGYAALGMNLAALRTNVGLMAALLELGRYGEAIDAGRFVLDALGGGGGIDVAPTREQAGLLTALVNQNLGGCYEYMGRYDEALGAYGVAEERYRALGMTARLGEILDNRGAILLYLGRGGEALAAHEAAAAIFEAAALPLQRAKALSNIGETYLYLGDYRQGLAALDRARRLLDSLGAVADKHLMLRYVANAYLELNLYSEALATYEEANEWLRDAGIEHGRAQTLWGMGSALIALSNFAEAERALRGAADKFAAAENTPMLSGVMLEQASLVAARGDQEGALVTTRRALDLLSEEDRPVECAYANLRLSDLLPDADKAEPPLLAAQRLAYRLSLPQLRYRLDERLGRLRRRQGRHEEARALLEAAVDGVERLRGTVAQEAMRASFLRDKTEAYEDLLLLHLARGDEEGVRLAFAVAERAKARTLTDLLTGVVGPDAVGADDDDGAPGARRRLVELQADLNATYNRMLAPPDEQETPLPDLQGRAVELEREISRLRLAAASAAASATAAAHPFAASDAPEDGPRERLPPDATLLAYHVAGEEILAFVRAGDGPIRVVRDLGSPTALRKLVRRLEAQWDRFLLGPEFVDRHAETLELSAQQVLQEIHAMLVAPLEGLLEGPGAPRKLAVVPHGPLHGIPFHALFDGERYLVERFEVSYGPSARVYALCQEREPGAPGAPGTAPGAPRRSLVVGLSDPLIPAATREARAVARSLPGAAVLGGKEATVDAVRALAPGSDVLHVACHGLFRSDNPMFSSLKLHDGWLTAADALGIDLSGALVTLSACESGRSAVFAGDEPVGLARAFLGAGAATLVVSLWVVHDETTTSAMEDYYGRLSAGARPAEALRAAQLATKERRPHPYYWAPFVLMGRR